jgi:molybdopterin molybdotransferase
VLRPEEAWALLEPRLAPLALESVPRRAALGRVLASAVAAADDVPAHDVSAMDGFALAGALPEFPLEIAATLAAGDPPGLDPPGGRAVRIMPGAPRPSGADRVVPVELTALDGDRVTVRRDVPAGANIRRRGEIHRRGERILESGELLTPGGLALLAAHGRTSVEVRRAPRLAILPTGDEVVAADAVPGPGQLRDSHTDFLLAACRTLGLAATPLPVAPDRADELRVAIDGALDHDVVLVTGGVSMGAYDLVEGALSALGCEILCDGVAMQPGKPLVIATQPRGLIFGLPGNPASSMVAVWLFVRPALRRLMGFEDGFWQGALRGRLDARLPAGKDRDRFIPAEARFRDGEIAVTPILPRGSHDLGSFGRGTALARIRPGAPELPAGGSVEILPIVHWPAAPDGNASD